MSHALHPIGEQTEAPAAPRRFHPLRVVAAALLGLLAVSFWIRWYAQEVSLPRYCDDPGGAVARLARVIGEPRPAGDEGRRPYLVAAKLLFLLPREAGEAPERYLARVRAHIEARCG